MDVPFLGERQGLLAARFSCAGARDGVDRGRYGRAFSNDRLFQQPCARNNRRAIRFGDLIELAVFEEPQQEFR